MIYLDSAAAVKLIHSEADSAALRGFLDERSEIEWVSSTLLEVETYRALVRARGRLTSFVTYDRRLAEAASAAGLTVDVPTG